MLLLAMLVACANAPMDGVEAIGAAELSALTEVSGDRVRVVSFWAMWCGPCLREVQLLRDTKREDASVVLVNIDTLDAYKRRAIPWLTDHDWSGLRMYRLDARDPVADLSRSLSGWSGQLPYTLFVRPEGGVCEEYSRVLTRTEVDEAIERCKQ